MSQRHIIAFDAGGTAVKAALYDERGEELAVAGAVMAPLHPAPGCLERDPKRCGRRSAKSRARSGGVGGRAVVDRRRRPDRLRQRALSCRSRRQAGPQRHPFGRTCAPRRSSRGGATSGLEDARIPLTRQRQWPGKPAPLIAWLEAHEPEALARAERALFCKDYLRFRLTGAFGLEISELFVRRPGRPRRAPLRAAILDHFGIGRYARLYGEGLEPLTIFGAVTQGGARRPGSSPGRRSRPATPTARRWRSGWARSTKA